MRSGNRGGLNYYHRLPSGKLIYGGRVEESKCQAWTTGEGRKLLLTGNGVFILADIVEETVTITEEKAHRILTALGIQPPPPVTSTQGAGRINLDIGRQARSTLDRIAAEQDTSITEVVIHAIAAYAESLVRPIPE